MFTDSIDRLKLDYTDKYVVVDNRQPELKRFGTAVGQVKTVNMSGRALVQFLDYHNNIAWYDIELDYLKVVDKPVEKPAEKHAKPAAEKPVAEKPAAAAGTAAPADKKLSVAEMLAAARSSRRPASAGKPPAKPAADKPTAPAAKKSTADILAAARGKAAAPAPVAKAAPEPVAAEPEPPVVEKPAAEAKPQGKGVLPKAVPDILAYCRKVDAK